MPRDHEQPDGEDPEARRYLESLEDELDELEDVAIAVELERGGEETVEQAKRHLVVRIVRVSAGLLLTLLGLAMLALPGPGLITVAAGLALLAQDVPFAARLLERVRKRLPADAEGGISKPFIVACASGGALIMGVSVWWTFFR